MYHHLCLPTDGSPLSEHAIDQALQLAKTLRARITAVFVTQPYHVFAVTPEQMVAVRDDYEREARDAARRHLRTVESRAHAASVPCESVVIEGADHFFGALQPGGGFAADVTARTAAFFAETLAAR